MAPDYYRRLVYIAGDRSERMLADACRHGVFANHPGRYLIRVVDAVDPGRYLLDDLSLPRGCARPLRAVFLNYVLDCLPAAHLRIPPAAGQTTEVSKTSEVSRLCVRTCLARQVPLEEYTELTAADLLRRAAAAHGPIGRRS